MSTPSSVTVRAPGKVNLQLSVGGAREDGFHELVSVFHAVELYDDVTVTPGEPGAGVTVEVSGAVTGSGVGQVPTDKSNIVVKAITLLAAEYAIEADVHVSISKGIPVAGGMAGGSADAAAALLAADHLWDLGLGREGLCRFAAMVGSDVPFILFGATALGTGRGEVITPVLTRGKYSWVFAMSDRGLSTPAVYGAFDRLNAGRPVPHPEASPTLMKALRSGSSVDLGLALRNDLQPAAISLRPNLERLLELGRECGALGSMVSGSGPTCAFLVEDEDSALDLVAALSGSGECSRVVRASSPAPGARIIGSPE